MTEERIREIIREEIRAYFSDAPEPEYTLLECKDETREALCGIFNRRLTTKWNAKEEKAYRIARPTLKEVAEVSKAKNSGWQYYRKDLLTALNNWSAEVDRARDYNLKHGGGNAESKHGF